jgi:hypothetical protein
MTGWLVVVFIVTTIHVITLVHHLCIHGVAVGSDLDAVSTTGHVLESAGGESNDHLLIVVESVVTFRGTTTVLALLKVVECQDGFGARCHRRRATVLWVSLTILATVWVVTSLAVARLSR